MNLVDLIVESRLVGPTSGQFRMKVNVEATAGHLIIAFCNDKHLPDPAKYALRTYDDKLMDYKIPLSTYGLVDGDVVYLVNRTYDDENYGYRSWFLISGICLVIAVCGLVAICLVFSANGDILDDYGIVFDAGSTHTTMMLYVWGGAKLNNTGKPKQLHKCEMQGGGISMFVGREDQLADMLEKCLNEAKDILPGGRVSTTYLFLGATGGMRILSLQNPAAVDKLFNTIDRTFAISGFKYQSGYARIISGYSEGADAWVTSNYLTNTIIPNKNINVTLGTLDLGGASTQWAYQVIDNGTMDLQLYGLTHTVLTNSSLCFGRYQSQLRHTAQLTVGLTDAEKNVTDPCLPKGSYMQISLHDIFDSPCTQMDSSLRPKLPESTNITIVGSSSSTNCSKQVATLFNESECMHYYKYQYCFRPQNLSQILLPYLAISGFYEVMYNLNLTDAQFTLKQFNDAVTIMCQKTLQETKLLKTKKDSSSTGLNYCYLGHYVNQLLTTGYSFNNDTWTNLNFVDSLNGTDLGWTLGFMINATNSIAPEPPLQSLDAVIFAMLITIFAIFILLGAAFAVHGVNKKRQPEIYRRLSQYGTI